MKLDYHCCIAVLAAGGRGSARQADRVFMNKSQVIFIFLLVRMAQVRT
jgi:hypothetical protein